MFFKLSRLFIAALWSPAGKWLTSWLLFVMFNCVLSLSHVVYWVRCGTWLYRFLIFATFLTSSNNRNTTHTYDWLGNVTVKIHKQKPMLRRGRCTMVKTNTCTQNTTRISIQARWISKYSKTCVKMPLSKDHKFKDQVSLNAGQKYCRMFQRYILQYFWPSLSYLLSLRSLFCLFSSGRLHSFYCMIESTGCKV